MNYIWGVMIIVSIVASMITGNIESVSNAAVDGAKNAIELSISLLGIMCLWSGIAKIGEKGGLIKALAKGLRPFMRLVFKNLDTKSNAYSSIVMNIAANFFGMGNAATPLGIKAIGDLEKENKIKTYASDEMCMFVVLNTASIQLIPTTLISLRQNFGANNPAEIVFPVWICEICALAVGITVAKLCSKRSKIKKE